MTASSDGGVRPTRGPAALISNTVAGGQVMPGVRLLRSNLDLMRATLYKLGTLCGLCAPILWAAVIILCGCLRPGYSHLTQYISELGERGSSTELLMRYAGFVPTGAMHVLFAASLWTAFRAGKLAAAPALLLALNGLGRVTAGLFPCEVGCAGPRVLLSQKLHTLAAGVGFFALIGAAVAAGIILRRQEGRGKLSAYSLVSGLLGLVFLLLMTLSGESRAGTGLYERLSSGILSLWVLVFAAALRHREASAGSGAA